MSITAIPILGRIFMELGLSHTRTAALTIGAAAIDDVTGWLLLGVVSLIVQRRVLAAAGSRLRIAGLAVYLAFVFVVARPLAKRAVARHLAAHAGRLSPAAIGLIFIGLFLSAAITSNLGVFAIIGGFVVGVMLHDDRAFVGEWKEQGRPDGKHAAAADLLHLHRAAHRHWPARLGVPVAFVRRWSAWSPSPASSAAPTPARASSASRAARR